MDCIVIHYSEIGLKKGNRRFFEDKLIKSIRERTGLKVTREYGRLITNYNVSVIKLLRLIPGISSFSPALKSSLSIDDFILKAKLLVTRGPFRVSAKRSNKGFKFTSPDINRLVGEALFNSGLKVNLSKPKEDLVIEVGDKFAYLYVKRYKGLGGLPIGTIGKMVCLLSGGIDSPVSAYEMIRRGCELVLIHFYNKKEGVKDKIFDIAKKLVNYQGSIKVVTIPFLDAQKEIIINVRADYRMIVYRRFMFRIAEKLLDFEGAVGFVTGDNIGQVASQTAVNMRVIWSVTNENVYAPLISRDKEDIIKIAKKIGTYDISIRPYSDCCSYVISDHPETSADLSVIDEEEKRLNVDKLVNDAFNAREEECLNKGF